jgi:hypothetical protein
MLFAQNHRVLTNLNQKASAKSQTWLNLALFPSSAYPPDNEDEPIPDRAQGHFFTTEEALALRAAEEDLGARDTDSKNFSDWWIQ